MPLSAGPAPALEGGCGAVSARGGRVRPAFAPRWAGLSVGLAAGLLWALSAWAAPPLASPNSAAPSAGAPRKAAPGAASPLAGQDMAVLPLPEVRTGLRQALAQGQNALAHDLALALTRALPRDYPAQAALAESLIRLERAGQAQAAARRAQELARHETEQFEANLLRARATALSGGALGGIAAGFWARRAVELAPVTGYRALAQDEARRLRQLAPLELQLAFSLSPSGNVNNGSREREITLPGWGGLSWALAPQSRALSGWIGELSLSGRYRLSETAVQATSLSFVAHHRAVRLSGASKAAIHDWHASQGQPGAPLPRYDFSVLEMGVAQSRQWGRGLWNLRGQAGHSWFGGRDLNDYLRLETGLQRPLGQGSYALGLVVEQQWGKAGNVADALVFGLEASGLRALARGDQLRLSGSLRQTESDNLDQRHRAAALRLGWQAGAPWGGLRLEGSLGAELRRYDPTLLAAGGRRDLRLDGQLSLGLEKLDYMGFAPMLNLSLGRVNSNVRLYEGTTTGISLRLRSVF